MSTFGSGFLSCVNWHLLWLASIILYAQSTTPRCAAPINLDSVMEWKGTQENLSRLYNKLQAFTKKVKIIAYFRTVICADIASQPSNHTNMDTNDWGSVEMFDKVAFLASLSSESIAMCKQLRENAEIGWAVFFFFEYKI